MNEQTQADEERTQDSDMALREEKIVFTLKQIDMGMIDHEDVLFLASELGVGKYFYN